VTAADSAAPGRCGTHPRAFAHQESVDLSGGDPQHAARVIRGHAFGEEPTSERSLRETVTGASPRSQQQPLAVLADQPLNRRRAAAARADGALGAQILKQRPDARAGQAAVVAAVLDEKARTTSAVS
jgi:hypothetical protein